MIVRWYGNANLSHVGLACSIKRDKYLLNAVKMLVVPLDTRHDSGNLFSWRMRAGAAGGQPEPGMELQVGNKQSKNIFFLVCYWAREKTDKPEYRCAAPPPPFPVQEPRATRSTEIFTYPWAWWTRSGAAGPCFCRVLSECEMTSLSCLHIIGYNLIWDSCYLFPLGAYGLDTT